MKRPSFFLLPAAIASLSVSLAAASASRTPLPPQHHLSRHQPQLLGFVPTTPMVPSTRLLLRSGT